MTLTRYKLGELIELVLKTNSELKYGPDDVKGMTITKEIIPTKADVTSADLSRFLVVGPNEFIYNPRTHGKRIGFGYNNTDSTFIISWNNIAFRVMPEKENTVLADYLFLHFKRDEWDREACFQSWGSSTEVFSWETLCDMEVDLPPLSIQQKYVDTEKIIPEYLMLWFGRKEFHRYTWYYAAGSVRDTFDFNLMQEVQIPLPKKEIQQDIVNIFSVYNARKKINERLKTQIKDICPILIKGSIEEARRNVNVHTAV